MMDFVVKTCIKCGSKRKFLIGSERDKQGICGECWDWTP
jgi:RNase P subunit RPR2